MEVGVTRRAIVGAPLAAVTLLGLPGRLLAFDRRGPGWTSFPSQEPSRVYDTVLYAHSDIDKVRALLEASPALANATMDWGFGDWETALGAASHMGRRDVAELLMQYGARPDIFTFAMKGNLAAVRAAIENQPGIEATFGPHGISLLAHARAGGEESRAVAEYLEELSTANPKQADEPMLFDNETYTGSYSWGTAEDERVAIIETRQGGLGFKVGERFPRTMFHLGDHEFHPGGAPHVRIRFKMVDGNAVSVSVLDPEAILVASRVQ